MSADHPPASHRSVLLLLLVMGATRGLTFSRGSLNEVGLECFSLVLVGLMLTLFVRGPWQGSSATRGGRVPLADPAALRLLPRVRHERWASSAAQLAGRMALGAAGDDRRNGCVRRSRTGARLPARQGSVHGEPAGDPAGCAPSAGGRPFPADSDHHAGTGHRRVRVPVAGGAKSAGRRESVRDRFHQTLLRQRGLSQWRARQLSLRTHVVRLRPALD